MTRTAVPPKATALLMFIQSIEAPRGWGSIFGNHQGDLAQPLTSMTLDAVIAAGPGWTRRYGSSAAGGLQFMNKTLKGLKAELGLTGAEKFDNWLQIELGWQLLKRRGYENFVAGKISRIAFGLALAQEWASFPVLAPVKGAHRVVKRGQTYYAGDGVNKQLVTPEAVERQLEKVLGGSTAPADPPATPAPPVVVEKPVVVDPENLDRPVTSTKTFWSWILTALTSIVTAIGALLDKIGWATLSPTVQIVILVVFAVLVSALAAYAILARHRLATTMRELRADVEATP